MVTPLDSSSAKSNQFPTMAKSSISRLNKPIWVSDSFMYLAGSLFVFFLVWSLWSFAAPNFYPGMEVNQKLKSAMGSPTCASSGNLGYDPPDLTYFDDPELSYSIEKSVKDWDRKRQEWLKIHPSFAVGARERVVMVTGSQSKPCKNPIGDHLLLRFFKNKVDYCRIHGYDIFYNNLLLNSRMPSYWAKLPVVKAAMLAHPEAEWIWWVDSDAMITDMEYKLPLKRYDYRNHNLVVHGWSKEIYNKRSWTGLNAGVFLIRNCQWSLDFMERWANMGPISKDYDKWGRIQRSVFKDKLFPESDDQTALAYMLYQDKRMMEKIYLEGEYYFQGYWVDIMPTFDNITEKYMKMERDDGRLRRRHAEKVSLQYGAFREPHLKDAGNGKGSWRRPFVTHFTGCQPCSGDHNQMYGGDTCWSGMTKALNFADNQVLRKYGFMRPDFSDSSTVVETPFDYPDEGPW